MSLKIEPTQLRVFSSIAAGIVQGKEGVTMHSQAKLVDPIQLFLKEVASASPAYEGTAQNAGNGQTAVSVKDSVEARIAKIQTPPAEFSHGQAAKQAVADSVSYLHTILPKASIDQKGTSKLGGDHPLSPGLDTSYADILEQQQQIAADLAVSMIGQSPKTESQGLISYLMQLSALATGLGSAVEINGIKEPALPEGIREVRNHPENFVKGQTDPGFIQAVYEVHGVLAVFPENTANQQRAALKKLGIIAEKQLHQLFANSQGQNGNGNGHSPKPASVTS